MQESVIESISMAHNGTSPCKIYLKLASIEGQQQISRMPTKQEADAVAGDASEEPAAEIGADAVS